MSAGTHRSLRIGRFVEGVGNFFPWIQQVGTLVIGQIVRIQQIPKEFAGQSIPMGQVRIEIGAKCRSVVEVPAYRWDRGRWRPCRSWRWIMHPSPHRKIGHRCPNQFGQSFWQRILYFSIA